ncbi:MAG: hypothetical protein HY595_03130, partial [Candidatus Omnitrophica bacterium]|nr:hypothetical protein [Candidatus Omnitrophota bacterium]
MLAIYQSEAIVQRVVELGIATPAQIEQAKQEQAKTREPISVVLAKLGIVRSADIGKRFAPQLGCFAQSVDPASLNSTVLRRLPLELCRTHRVVPIQEDPSGHVVVASDEPFTAIVLEWLGKQCQATLEMIFVDEAGLAALLIRLSQPDPPAPPIEPKGQAGPVAPASPPPSPTVSSPPPPAAIPAVAPTVIGARSPTGPAPSKAPPAPSMTAPKLILPASLTVGKPGAQLSRPAPSPTGGYHSTGPSVVPPPKLTPTPAAIPTAGGTSSPARMVPARSPTPALPPKPTPPPAAIPPKAPSPVTPA